MADKKDGPHEAPLLFVRSPVVRQMRDPLDAEWNREPRSDLAEEELDLAQLIDFGQMNAIFQSLLEVIGLPVAIVDFQGRVLASSNWQRLCLTFHRTHSGTLARCRESDISLSRQMQEGKTYAIYRCRNGLTDCASPIVVEGRHVANLFIGQFLLNPPDPDYFEAQRAEFGFDKADYFKALAEVPIVSEEKLPAILSLLTGLAKQLAAHSVSEYRAKAAYASVERQIAERTAELQVSYDLLHNLATQVPGVIYQYRVRADGSAHMPYASDAMRAMFRLEPEAVKGTAQPVHALLHPDDYAAVMASIQQSALSLTVWKQRFRIMLADDDVRWLLGHATPQREADGSTLWHGFVTDVTEDVSAEGRLRLAASVFANTREGILITDPKGRIVDVNPAFTDITGYTREEVLGHLPKLLSAGRHGAVVPEAMWRSLRETGAWRGEVWNRDKNGEAHPHLISISAVCDEAGKVSRYVGVFSDITYLKQHEAELELTAHYDALTRLPNRLLLADRLRQAVVLCHRHARLLAVVYLDLDGFKAVNDQHCHDVGDELLIALAQRMKAALREGDTLARIGGDEFVAVLTELESPHDWQPVVNRLLHAAAGKVVVRELTLQVSASIGVTVYPQDPTDAAGLLRHADEAMYAAKQAGRNSYHLYNAEQRVAEKA
ncbi:PocR ligand-binding domain-containing protein [Methylococcus sp. EFPC2]|uniref:PocR ligand-binding domain-containing protein n=1 Tax=Methylococcus sp. EFPC2 TaxID=2812648 RepID=UPI0019680D61|nr:PocR ligand-binding domain-containing protein [Methylococcus sp. EFPC2]QSA95890.1 diguanylate cyclase [Methylococcus sp. EFPC2]